MSTDSTTQLPSTRRAVTTRRRPILILGGIVLAIMAGLLSFYLYSASQTQNAVIQVRRDIARGEVIRDKDLVAITVGAVPGVSTVPASERRSLVGKRALVDLRSNALLPAGAIGAKPMPGPGRSLIGIKVEPGRIMTGNVPAGSKLRLVVTESPGNTPQQADPTKPAPKLEVSYPAVMISASQALDGAASIITVEVDHDQAEEIAPLAAAGRLVVVKDADR